MENIVYEYFTKYIESKNINEFIKEAMCYSVISDGKLIRPLVFFHFLEEFGIKPENYVNIACAIEMIHTYSLIHDDLPAMDNDDYRRGKLTTHKKFGEDIAILTGDALLTHSFEVLIENELLEDEQKILLIKELVNCCGTNSGMINGQVIDIKSDIKNRDDLEKLHFQKTTRLLQFCVISSLIVSKNMKFSSDLNLLMEKLGLLYQVKDDYLDYFSKDDLGKDKNSDVKNCKFTYVDLYGKDEDKLNEYIEELKVDCTKIIIDNNFSDKILNLVKLFGDRKR